MARSVWVWLAATEGWAYNVAASFQSVLEPAYPSVYEHAGNPWDIVYLRMTIYLHRWDLDPAIDVLTMCICHLPSYEPLWSEVLLMRKALQRYRHILNADEHYSTWQEVEDDCKKDPEGLALRLAGKGLFCCFRSCQSASLSVELRENCKADNLLNYSQQTHLVVEAQLRLQGFFLHCVTQMMPYPLLLELCSFYLTCALSSFLCTFLKRRVGNLSDTEVAQLNLWALGLRVLALLPSPSQQRCSALHEHPHLILEVTLMMKQLQSASLILKDFPSLRDDNLILAYAAKAITVNVGAAHRETRISVSGSRSKQKTRSGTPSMSNFASSIGNWQREARWLFRGLIVIMPKIPPKDVHQRERVQDLCILIELLGKQCQVSRRSVPQHSLLMDKRGFHLSALLKNGFSLVTQLRIMLFVLLIDMKLLLILHFSRHCFLCALMSWPLPEVLCNYVFLR
ncbi:unnamed protein product [Musa acuminata subsp. burmannicoides]